MCCSVKLHAFGWSYSVAFEYDARYRASIGNRYWCSALSSGANRRSTMKSQVFLDCANSFKATLALHPAAYSKAILYGPVYRIVIEGYDNNALYCEPRPAAICMIPHSLCGVLAR